MAYPRNDTDFVEGVVTYVVDNNKGDMIKVGHHMPNWGLPGGYKGCGMQPRPDFEIKPGMKIRIYAFQGLPIRGVYIAGRIVRPYISKAEGRDWRKRQAEGRRAHRRTKQT